MKYRELIADLDECQEDLTDNLARAHQIAEYESSWGREQPSEIDRKLLALFDQVAKALETHSTILAELLTLHKESQ